MKVPVLTAVADADREAALVAAFEEAGSSVRVVRRCVDLADLLATAAAGTARAALVDPDLRRLDRDALARLAVCGVAVVGVAADDDAERRLRRLGVLHVAAATAAPGAIAETVVAAVAAVTLGSPPAETPPAPEPTDDVPDDPGRVVAVWGPAGAPGRTTLAVNLATELAALGERTLLVDADVYGGSVAQALGLLDEAPGLAAAARLANNGLLDAPGLRAVARDVNECLGVLTGITRAERWSELRPAAVETVLGLCRRAAAYTVVDCAFCVEDDPSRRNAATLAVLADADTVLAVGSADPVSLQRLVRGLGDLGRDATVVVNRLRDGVMPGDPRTEITRALDRYAGVTPEAFLPYDPGAADRATMRGLALAEAAPDAPLRHAVAGLARALAGRAAEPKRRRLLRR